MKIFEYAMQTKHMCKILSMFAYPYASVWIYRLHICTRLSIYKYMDVWTVHMQKILRIQIYGHAISTGSTYKIFKYLNMQY